MTQQSDKPEIAKYARTTKDPGLPIPGTPETKITRERLEAVQEQCSYWEKMYRREVNFHTKTLAALDEVRQSVDTAPWWKLILNRQFYTYTPISTNNRQR